MGPRETSHRRVKSSVHAAALAALGIASLAPLAVAATDTWTGSGGDFQWSNAGNWTPATPGTNDGSAGASSDIALITQPGGTGTQIILDPNRNVGGITFDITTIASGRQVGEGTGPTLFLSGGGTVMVSSTTVANSSSTINAPMVLNGTSYTFRNDSTDIDSGLKLNGPISGGNAGATTIFLDGVNLANATTSNSQVQGAITNGLSSSVGLIKNGTGVWELRPTAGANTYSGDTVINGGLLRIMSTVNALSPNSNLIVNNGGTLRFNITGAIGKSVTVNTGGIAMGSADAVITSLATNSGPALFYNFTGTTGAVSQGFMLKLTGTVAGQGGVKLAMQDATGKVTFSKNIDLGSVNRVFDIAHSSTNGAVQDPDLQVTGIVSGTGGIIKTGPGTLKLNNAANTFSGTLEIQQGSFRYNSANAMNASAPLLVDGGDFDVQGNNQAMGAVTVTKGSISASSGTPGVISSPIYSLNVGTGDTATIQAGLANAGGASPLSKTGGGSATLNGPLAYTGATTMSGGSLSIGGNLTTSSAINITAGTMKLASNGTNMRVIKTPSLSITGGKLNLTDNKLIVTGGAAGSTWNGGAYDGVAGLVASGYNGGTQDGSGIVTDQSNAQSPSVLTQLVTVSADDSGYAGGVFGGQSVASGDQLVMYTWGGDANLDGTLNGDDYFQIDSHFNQDGTIFGYYNGDFNYDGSINGDDYFIIDSNWNTGSTAAPFPTGGGLTGVAAVPEPSSLAALGVAAGMLIAARRRRVAIQQQGVA